MALISPPVSLPQKTVYFNRGMQEYMHRDIKKPLLDGFEVLSSETTSRIQKLRALKKMWDAFIAIRGLPEPTKDNTWHPNTHKLIELRDYLTDRCKLGVRTAFVKNLMNFAIVLYDFDPPWRWIMDSVKDEALSKEWKPRGFQDTWTETYEWWEE